MTTRSVGACVAVVLMSGAVARGALLDDKGGDDRRRLWKVDCDRGHSIGRVLRRVRPGDIVSVVGFCIENVEIPEGVSRLVLDGNGAATISAADPNLDAVQIYGDDITVQGFSITGGRDGVNLRGALNIVVENNTIQGNQRIGVNVHRISFALIVGNSIRDNGSFGISLVENASARIGFKETTDAAPQPNAIEENAGHGVYVARSSNAFIAGNTISRNARNGVHLEKNGQAEVTANAIDGNGASGVFVTQNSGAHLGSPAGPRWMDLPNMSSVPNTAFGVQCSIGAYLVGSLGLLNGTGGPKDVATGCVDTIR